MMELGGNIQLVGFREVDGGSMIIIKKIVGNYVRQFSGADQKFQSFSLTLKQVHEHSDDSGKYELHAKLIGEREHNAEIVDYNLMFAVDKVLKKIENSLNKK